MREGQKAYAGEIVISPHAHVNRIASFLIIHYTLLQVFIMVFN